MGLRVMLLTAALDEAYNETSWHGTNLKGAIRGVGIEEAGWRPASERHNIWEITVHASYWKYAVWRRLSGAKRGSFAIKGSDWFLRPLEPTLQAWRADKALLEEEHRKLREAVQILMDKDLHRCPNRGQMTIEKLVRGIAAHDLYHAGQIQLLKRMFRHHRSGQK